MIQIKIKIILIPMMTVFIILLFKPAFAYIGPGGVLSGIGSFIALVGAIILAIIGFLWFPIKRLLKKIRNNRLKKTGTDLPIR